MRQIKKLEIYFENCEGIVVPIDCIESINIRKTTKEQILHKYRCDNELTEYEFITNGTLCLTNFNKLTHVDDELSTLSPLTRLLTYRDITQLHFIFDDGSSKTFDINWGDDMTENNSNQYHSIVDGSLHIDWTDAE